MASLVQNDTKGPEASLEETLTHCYLIVNAIWRYIGSDDGLMCDGTKQLLTQCSHIVIKIPKLSQCILERDHRYIPRNISDIYSTITLPT